MPDTITYTERDGAYLIRFEGDIRVTLCASFDTFIDTLFSSPALHTIILDLSEARNIDSTTLGMIAKIAARSKEQLGYYPTAYSPNPDIKRLLECMGLNMVLNIAADLQESESLLKQKVCTEMPCATYSPEHMCDKVIEAHRELMALKPDNKEKFKELISGLEQERLHYQANR